MSGGRAYREVKPIAAVALACRQSLSPGLSRAVGADRRRRSYRGPTGASCPVR